MCCGKKRTELRNSEARDTTASVKQPLLSNRPSSVLRTPISRAQPALAGRVEITPLPTIRLRYLQTSPVRVRGLVSGVCYEFSGSSPVQDVDARDSTSLVHTRFFRRE